MTHSPSGDPLLDFLKRTIQERSSLAEVGRELSPTNNPSWLSRSLLGERRLSVVRVRDILDEIGVDERRFWSDYVRLIGSRLETREMVRPQDVLLRVGGDAGNTVSWLDRVDRVQTSPIKHGAKHNIPSMAREIDALRDSNRESASFRSEIWILELLQKGTDRGVLRERETVELATALGVWASIQRVSGHALLASRALALGLEMHGSSQTSPAYADLLERAGVTLREVGYAEIGLALLKRAVTLYRIHGLPWNEAKALVRTGVMAFQAQELNLAEGAFRRCLESSELDDRLRASALDGLAAIALDEGEIETAKGHLEEAMEIGGLPPRIRLQVLWRAAKLARHEGQLAEAADQIEEVLIAGTDHIEPLDLFLLFFDFSEALELLGDQHRFNRHVPVMSRLLPLLEAHPSASAVAASFLRAAIATPLASLSVSSTRRAFIKACVRDRQPPGSATPPIS